MKQTTDSVGICQRIRQLRVEVAGARGKAAFARKINISPSTYDYYESTRVPPADVLVRIAEVTRIDLRWLLTGCDTQAEAPITHPALLRAAALLRDHPQYAPALAAFLDLLGETAATLPDEGSAAPAAAKGLAALVADDSAAPAAAKGPALLGADDSAAPAAAKGPALLGADDSAASAAAKGPAPLVAAEIPAPASRSVAAAPPVSGAAGLVAAFAPPQPAQRGKALATDTTERRDTRAIDNKDDRQGWIPILGRSAAGVPHFWADTGADDGGATTLASLIAHLQPRNARHVAEARATGELAGQPHQSVQLVLLDAPESPGTAEFVIAEHIARQYDVLFAVRIDGESMAPEIRHGDVVILSPASPAEPGLPAVVQLTDQIGVTCKLIRFENDHLHLIPINESVPTTTHSRSDLIWALKVVARVRPV